MPPERASFFYSLEDVRDFVAKYKIDGARRTGDVDELYNGRAPAMTWHTARPGAERPPARAADAPSQVRPKKKAKKAVRSAPAARDESEEDEVMEMVPDEDKNLWDLPWQRCWPILRGCARRRPGAERPRGR